MKRTLAIVASIISLSGSAQATTVVQPVTLSHSSSITAGLFFGGNDRLVGSTRVIDLPGFNTSLGTLLQVDITGSWEILTTRSVSAPVSGVNRGTGRGRLRLNGTYELADIESVVNLGCDSTFGSLPSCPRTQSSLRKADIDSSFSADEWNAITSNAPSFDLYLFSRAQLQAGASGGSVETGTLRSADNCPAISAFPECFSSSQLTITYTFREPPAPSQVPLPAAGFGLLTAMSALAMLRARRRTRS